jgi:hypothetical protein
VYFTRLNKTFLGTERERERDPEEGKEETCEAEVEIVKWNLIIILSNMLQN